MLRKLISIPENSQNMNLKNSDVHIKITNVKKEGIKLQGIFKNITHCK